jgi:hypothetical protein
MVKIRREDRLKIKDLEALPINKIFAGGLAHLYLPEGTGPVRWIAVRSGSVQWAIFYGHPDKTEQEIKEKGWRLTDTIEIPKLVPCTAGALEKYRLY